MYREFLEEDWQPRCFFDPSIPVTFPRMFDRAGPLTLWERLVGRFRTGTNRILRSKGSYRFLSLLGKGGMGEVWLAEKLGANGFSKLVAIKTIHHGRLDDPRMMEMFLDEARLVANLIHPNIVEVFQLNRHRGEVNIIMEHVFGVPLLNLLETTKKLNKHVPIDVAAFIIARVAHGLYYAHMKHSRLGSPMEIVHRDICPSNILLSFRGIPKLTDFGVAKASSSTVDDEGNVVWGKFPYMAPEAVLRKGTDPRSDIYALGLVLFELLTGELAHDAGSTRALQKVLATEEPKDLDARRLNPDVPEPLVTIVQKAAHQEADARYTSALAMAEDLEQFLLQHLLFPDENRLSSYLMTLYPEARVHRWW